MNKTLVSAVLIALGLGIFFLFFIGDNKDDSKVEVSNIDIKNTLTDQLAARNDEVALSLGTDHTAQIKPNTGNFDITMAARLLTREDLSEGRLQYKIVLESLANSCLNVIGKEKTEALFAKKVNTYIYFDTFESSIAYTNILLKSSAQATACKQKAFIYVIDTQDNNRIIGEEYFIIDLQSS